MAESGHKYVLCDLTKVVGSGHNELWRPLSTKVRFRFYQMVSGGRNPLQIIALLFISKEY